jgi:hypothetical protein
MSQEQLEKALKRIGLYHLKDNREELKEALWKWYRKWKRERENQPQPPQQPTK